MQFLFTFLVSLLLIETFFHFFGPKPQLPPLHESKAPTVAVEKMDLPLEKLSTTSGSLVSFAVDSSLYLTFNPKNDASFGANGLLDLRKENGESIELISSPKAPILLFTDSASNNFQAASQEFSSLGKWLAQANVGEQFLLENSLFFWNPSLNAVKQFTLNGKGEISVDDASHLPAIAFYLDQQTPVPFGLLSPSPSGPKLQSLSEVLSVPKALLTPVKNSLFSKALDKEHLITLENNSLQVVIDTLSGEIIEVNLPFTSSATDHIRSVEVDRLLEGTAHGYFPFHETQIASSDGSITVYPQKEGGYYPLLRRDSDFKGKLGALLDGNGQSVEPSHYTLQQATRDSIVLEGQTPSRKLKKTFSLKKDLPHTFSIAVEVDGDRSDLWMSSFALEAEGNSSGVLEQIKYRTIAQEQSAEETYSISLPKSQKDYHDLGAKWVLHSNGFFGTILDPSFPIEDLKLTKVPGEEVLSRYSLKDLPKEKVQQAKKHPWTQIQMRLPAKEDKAFVQIFAGPISRDLLSQVDAQINSSNEKSAIAERVQYANAVDFVGWFAFILRPFVKVMMLVLEQLHRWTNSWGIALILFTCLIRGVLFPLNSWSTRKMMHNQKVQPKLAQLQKKYKKDPQTLRLKTIEFYKKEGINPLSGCLPMLIQLPFLFAMLNLLRHTVQLRGVTLIPGWIDDLAAPDAIAQLPFAIPFLGSSLHLLPILLALITYLQAKMSTPPVTGNDKESKEKATQQQTMAWVSSAMFGFFFYSMPSGLNLYWLISTLLGLAERAWIRRKTKA